ncbi:hypothetical protein SAMN04489841_3638 [Natrinema salaciae]|uniref:Uncharacterized protein n=1 Tax=Natrinema salaciae TaxID=1186196 RepID=A0A1H9NKM8_9EURY|nr:hypothetical protein SAMN04489841_3638 [Natrinema salaciae]
MRTTRYASPIADRDGRGDGGDDREVTVGDVSNLVSEDRFEFVPVELLEQSRRDDDRRRPLRSDGQTTRFGSVGDGHRRGRDIRLRCQPSDSSGDGSRTATLEFLETEPSNDSSRGVSSLQGGESDRAEEDRTHGERNPECSRQWPPARRRHTETAPGEDREEERVDAHHQRECTSDPNLAVTVRGEWHTVGSLPNSEQYFGSGGAR